MFIADKWKHYSKLQRRYGWKAIAFLTGRKLTGNKNHEIKLKGIPHPVTLSNLLVDVYTMLQIFYGKEYDIRLDSEPKYIIDCGANIGLASVYFANKFPNATIIAVEPDSRNFAYLKKNVAPYPNVHCLQKAIWSKPALMEVVDPGRGNWGYQTKEVEVSDHSIEGITIDQIIEEYVIPDIDFLKIDIEGAEKELFMHNYENWITKAIVIAVELHDFFDPTISPVFNETISKYNFEITQLGENTVCRRK